MQDYVIRGGHVAYLDHYYFDRPKILADADPQSFEQLDRWLGRDRHRVYFLHAAVEGADPASFTVLGGHNDLWAKDATRAYHFQPSRSARHVHPLEVASLERFAILPHCRFDEYAGDAQHIFRAGKPVRGADAASFRVLLNAAPGEDLGAPSFSFARDASRIYYLGVALTGVSVAAFRALRLPGVGHSEYGTDGVRGFTRNYRTGKRVDLAFPDLPADVREAYREALGRP